MPATSKEKYSQLDTSQLTSVQISGKPIEQVLNSVHYGSPELRFLLMDECDLIFECKVCRSLFRDVPKFLSHKQVFCNLSHSGNRPLTIANLPEERVLFVQPDASMPVESVKASVSEQLSRSARPNLEEIVTRLRSGSQGNSQTHLHPTPDTSYKVIEKRTDVVFGSAAIPTNKNVGTAVIHSNIYDKATNDTAKTFKRDKAGEKISNRNADLKKYKCEFVSPDRVSLLPQSGMKQTPTVPGSKTQRKDLHKDLTEDRTLLPVNGKTEVCTNTLQAQEQIASSDDFHSLASEALTDHMNSDDAELNNMNSDDAELNNMNSDDAELNNMNSDDAELNNMNSDDAELNSMNSDDAELNNMNSDDAELNKRTAVPSLDCEPVDERVTRHNVCTGLDMMTKKSTVRRSHGMDFNMLTHQSSGKTFTCPFCPKVFCYLFRIVQHLQNKHSKTVEEIDVVCKQLERNKHGKPCLSFNTVNISRPKRTEILEHNAVSNARLFRNHINKTEDAEGKKYRKKSSDKPSCHQAHDAIKPPSNDKQLSQKRTRLNEIAQNFLDQKQVSSSVSEGEIFQHQKCSTKYSELKSSNNCQGEVNQEVVCVDKEESEINHEDQREPEFTKQGLRNGSLFKKKDSKQFCFYKEAESEILSERLVMVNKAEGRRSNAEVSAESCQNRQSLPEKVFALERETKGVASRRTSYSKVKHTSLSSCAGHIVDQNGDGVADHSDSKKYINIKQDEDDVGDAVRKDHHLQNDRESEKQKGQSADNYVLHKYVSDQSSFDQSAVERMIDVKNIKCFQCGKSYSLLFNLRNHVICEHLKWTRFKCKMCDFHSYYRSDCFKHLRKFHRKGGVSLAQKSQLIINLLDLHAGKCSKRLMGSINRHSLRREHISSRVNMKSLKVHQTETGAVNRHYRNQKVSVHIKTVEASDCHQINDGRLSRTSPSVAQLEPAHSVKALDLECKKVHFKRSSSVAEIKYVPLTASGDDKTSLCLDGANKSEYRKSGVCVSTSIQCIGDDEGESKDFVENHEPETSEGVSLTYPAVDNSSSNQSDLDHTSVDSLIDLNKLKCLWCGKSYSLLFNLRNHVICEHLNWTRFKCRLCDFKSYYKCDCIKHLKKFHFKHTFSLKKTSWLIVDLQDPRTGSSLKSQTGSTIECSQGTRGKCSSFCTDSNKTQINSQQSRTKKTPVRNFTGSFSRLWSHSRKNFRPLETMSPVKQSSSKLGQKDRKLSHLTSSQERSSLCDAESSLQSSAKSPSETVTEVTGQCSSDRHVIKKDGSMSSNYNYKDDVVKEGSYIQTSKNKSRKQKGRTVNHFLHKYVSDQSSFDESLVDRMIDVSTIKCLQCGKSYSLLCNLRNHVICEHLNWTRFKCGVCDFQCYFKSDCIKHFQKCHLKDTLILKRKGQCVIDLQKQTPLAESCLESQTGNVLDHSKKERRKFSTSCLENGNSQPERVKDHAENRRSSIQTITSNRRNKRVFVEQKIRNTKDSGSRVILSQARSSGSNEQNQYLRTENSGCAKSSNEKPIKIKGRTILGHILRKPASSHTIQNSYDWSEVDKMIDKRMLKCLQCGRSYSLLFSLRNHVIQKHLGWSRFRCRMCGFQSYYRFDCVRHLEKSHGKTFRGKSWFIVDLLKGGSNRRTSLKKQSDIIKKKSIKRKGNACVYRKLTRKLPSVQASPDLLSGRMPGSVRGITRQMSDPRDGSSALKYFSKDMSLDGRAQSTLHTHPAHLLTSGSGATEGGSASQKLADYEQLVNSAVEPLINSDNTHKSRGVSKKLAAESLSAVTSVLDNTDCQMSTHVEHPSNSRSGVNDICDFKNTGSSEVTATFRRDQETPSHSGKNKFRRAQKFRKDQETPSHSGKNKFRRAQKSFNLAEKSFGKGKKPYSLAGKLKRSCKVSGPSSENTKQSSLSHDASQKTLASSDHSADSDNLTRFLMKRFGDQLALNLELMKLTSNMPVTTSRERVQGNEKSAAAWNCPSGEKLIVCTSSAGTRKVTMTDPQPSSSSSSTSVAKDAGRMFIIKQRYL